MLAFIIWMIVNERTSIKKNLREVTNGSISQRQYNTAISSFRRMHISPRSRQEVSAPPRIHQLLGELAHKEQLPR
jgi:hypothetical protein